MPKLSNAIPRYRKHKGSGQAVIRLGSRDIYLGKYGSAASREAYKRAIAEWSQRGNFDAAPPASITVSQVLLAYVNFALGYYVKDGEPTNEVRMVKSALSIVRSLYARTPAAEFGPLALKACRGEMIRKGWCRSHSNKQTDRIKRMFKWATSEELVPGSV